MKAYLLIIALFISMPCVSQEPQKNTQSDREYLVQVLTTIADPLLVALSKGELKSTMPFEENEGLESYRKEYMHLEGFGRLMAGMAPWLELGPDQTHEGRLREKYIKLAVKSIGHAVDPESPDFMNFSKGDQPLVDAAFFAHALLRAPTQLWGNLSSDTQAECIEALKSSRDIVPYYSNWLLFSGMIEAALLKFDGRADLVRLDYAVMKHLEWYLGDGIYGDGNEFHFDYYNSYVIQPMLIDILKTVENTEGDLRQSYNKSETYDLVVKRAQRYAEIQERLISPEGTFPVVGRSLVYRFGAFQLLSQIALMQNLPASLTPAQTRGALTAVVKRTMSATNTFDKDGWLQIGFYGSQPAIAESYITTGSLYLCSVGLLCLGLPANNEFWTAPAEPWTSKKAWAGTDVPADKALK